MRRFAVLLLAGAPALLHAQGFAVNEHNTCTMGRAGAVVASPCADGSALFYNPAGLSSLTGTHIVIGGTLILPFGNFTRDPAAGGGTTDIPSQSYPVPSVAITRSLNSRIGVGVGLFFPYGLGTKWCSDVSGDCVTPLAGFEGRFAGYNTSLRSMYIQPTVGVKLRNNLSVGLGIDYIHSTVELHQRGDLSAVAVAPGITFGQLGIPAYTDFVDAVLKASGNGVAFHFGAQWKATDDLSFGFRYLSQRRIKYDGTANFTQVLTGLILPPGNPINPGTPVPVDNAIVAPLFLTGGPLSDQTAKTEVTMPMQIVLGFAWKVRPDLTLNGDYQQIRFGVFDKLVLDFSNAATSDQTLYENYRASHGIRLGTEWARNSKLTLRGGYLYHSAAAPSGTVTPLLPEGERNEFTIGIGYNLTAKLHGDAAYQYIKQSDRRGRLIGGPNTGLYTFGANLLGAGLSYTF